MIFFKCAHAVLIDVFLPVTYDDAPVKHEGEDDSREYPCLVRVTDGKKANLSTRVRIYSYLCFTAAYSLVHLIVSFKTNSFAQVEPGQLDAFHVTYGTLLKGSMGTLRKRDKKREKQRAEEAAKRKRRMTEPIPIEGPKRGSGRKKRQRRIKAAMKQEDSRQQAQKREEAKGKVKST
jgi:signal recognition particle subunit SRP14